MSAPILYRRLATVHREVIDAEQPRRVTGLIADFLPRQPML